MDIVTSPCLVIGAGLSGMRTALGLLSKGITPCIISSVPSMRSHSAAAMGGIQAALGTSVMGDGDSPALHYDDTVSGGAFMNDTGVVRYFCETVVDEIYRMDSYGVPWTRVEGKSFKPFRRGLGARQDLYRGKIAGRNFGGTAKWRTCYCSDATGHDLMRALNREVAARGGEVLDRCKVLSLITDGGRICGAVCLNMRSMKLFAVRSAATVIATGGFGRLYARTTNGSICSGSGHDLVFQTGHGVLASMEAVQFHPTCLVPSSLLVTEACRGDGGYLLDSRGERFLSLYYPKTMECSRRDQITRAMVQRHMDGFSRDDGAGPYFELDIRHLGRQHIKHHLQEVYEMCIFRLGLDPVKNTMPVYPGQHYSMGGIRTDFHHSASSYGCEGLYAVGEAACWDLHGFNRLGGNSLGEALVSGAHAADSVSAYINNRTEEISDTLLKDSYSEQIERFRRLANSDRSNHNSVFAMYEKLRHTMSSGAGILRSEEGLTETIRILNGMYDTSETLIPAGGVSRCTEELLVLLELPGMIRIALAVAASALNRRESRGCHIRTDYPHLDENFARRTLVRWDADNRKPVITYEPIT